MNALDSDDGWMLRSWFMRIYRGIYGYISLIHNVQRAVLSRSYLSDILVAFVASHSQPGKAEDNPAPKDCLFGGLDALLPISFKVPVIFCGCLI